MNIAVVGLSHKTAPVEVREKLSIPEPQIESAIAQLAAIPILTKLQFLALVTAWKFTLFPVKQTKVSGK